MLHLVRNFDMFSYVVYCLHIFFMVLEVILVMYMLQNFFYVGRVVRLFLLMLVYPMLAPLQGILKYSILNTFSVDLSPYLALVMLNYCCFICEALL